MAIRISVGTPLASVTLPDGDTVEVDLSINNKRITWEMDDEMRIMLASYPSLRAPDPGLKAMITALLSTIGCRTCHRRRFMRALNNATTPAGSATIGVGCAACKNLLLVEIPIVAIARRNPSNVEAEMVAHAQASLAPLGYEWWEERDNAIGVPIVHINANDHHALYSHHSARAMSSFGSRDSLNIHGVTCRYSMHAPMLVPKVVHTAQELTEHIAALVDHGCPCGAHNAFECRKSCRRPPGAVEAALVLRQ